MNNHLYLLALGTILLGSSCSKKGPDTPAPTTEVTAGPSITGLIQPADAVFGVSLVDNATHQTTVSTAPDSKGAFRFDAVPAGTYEVSFDSQGGYVRPRQLSVTVTAGKTTVVPPVAVVRSTASLTADGVALPTTLVSLSLAFDGKILPAPRLFSIILSNGNPNLRTNPRLFLTMPYAVQVGTYSLNDGSTYAIFDDPRTGIFDPRLTPATVPSGSTLTITAVENVAPFPRSVSGTFSFTGTSPLGTQKTISGTFENAYF